MLFVEPIAELPRSKKELRNSTTKTNLNDGFIAHSGISRQYSEILF